MKLTPAEHRAIYFWAGPGTVRMNLLKHDLPINETAHLKGYSEYGLEKLVEMGITVAYCTFNWGFAPEIEADDWESFARFAELCHARGIEVFAYIQSSNFVWEDWFANHPESLDWLRRDRCGRSIVYAKRYPKRYYTCYNNPGWRDQVTTVTRQVLKYRPDGIFVDNVHISDEGCYCRYCREGFAQYLDDAGLPRVTLENIKEDMEERDYREWIRFRCRTVDDFLSMVRDLIDSEAPGTVMTSNTFDIVNMNRPCDGVDPRQAIEHQELWMIESFTFPRMEDGMVVNNARTYKVAQAIGRGKFVTSVANIGRSRERRGKGDIEPYPTLYTPVYTPDEYRLGIAEAAAHQAGLVIKGTEYYDEYWTILTEERFAEARAAIGQYHRFLEEHRHLYGGTSVATVGLVFHQDSLCWTRAQAFPSFIGFMQTLFRANIQYDILTEHELERQGTGRYRLIILPNILCPSEAELDGLSHFVDKGGHLLITGEIGTHNRNGDPRTQPIGRELLRHSSVTYLEECPGKMDLPDTALQHTRTTHFEPPHFELPVRWQELAAKIIDLSNPVVAVESDDKVSVVVYEQDTRYVTHVVNYDSDKTAGATKLRFSRSVKQVEGYSPDMPLTNRLTFHGKTLTIRGTRVYDVVVASW